MARFMFSKFDVTRQVFISTQLSFGVVNLKPIVPGHVLIVPRRVVPRISELTKEELTDIFETVQRVGQVVEKAFKGEALTIACQDGEAAGQSVPHVHIHVMPRKFTDFGGRNDDIYPAMDKSEAELHDQHEESAKRTSRLKVDDEDRQPRTTEEMETEALWLKSFFPDSQRSDE